MSDYQNILNQYGLDSEEVENIEISATDTSYQFQVGDDYVFIIGNVHYYYKNADDKKCKKNDPGAKLAFAMLDFLTISKGKDVFVDDHLQFNKDLPPTAFKFGVFLPLEADKQYQNKRTFESFYIDEKPELAIVKEDGRDYTINFSFLPLYRGCPVKASVKKGDKEKSRPYLTNIEITDHTIDKTKLANRKIVVDKLYEQLNTLWDAVKKNKKADNEEIVTEADINPDDILNQYVGS